MSDGRRRPLLPALLALVALLGLAACSKDEAPAAPDIAPPATVDTSTEEPAPDLGSCPADLVASIEVEHGATVTVADLAMVEAGLVVDLPDGAECVLTYPSGAPGVLTFHIYWPGEGAAFAEPVGQAVLRGGFEITPGTLSYANGSRTAEMVFHRLGDEDWGQHFGAEEVMELRGTIDEGGATDPAPDAGDDGGVTLTWEDSCMLTLGEVNAAAAPLGMTFDRREHWDNGSTTCVYTQAVVDTLPVRFEVLVLPYEPQSTFGFAADTSWSAPNAVAGAANACAAATATPYLDGLTARCEVADGVTVVLGASRLHAVVFRPGPYLYVVQALNIGGSDELTQPLLDMAWLLASREPVER